MALSQLPQGKKIWASMHLPNKEQYGLPMGLSSPSNSRERRQEFEKDKEKGTYKVGLWLEKTLQGET